MLLNKQSINENEAYSFSNNNLPQMLILRRS
jgi:hypothetical protein